MIISIATIHSLSKMPQLIISVRTCIIEKDNSKCSIKSTNSSLFDLLKGIPNDAVHASNPLLRLYYFQRHFPKVLPISFAASEETSEKPSLQHDGKSHTHNHRQRNAELHSLGCTPGSTLNDDGLIGSTGRRDDGMVTVGGGIAGRGMVCRRVTRRREMCRCARPVGRLKSDDPLARESSMRRRGRINLDSLLCRFGTDRGKRNG